MRNKPEHDLSLMGAQRLGDWLRKQKALSPPVLEAVGTETLVRYCAGLLTAQEAEAVEGTLAADPIGRERWLQVHEILNALQQLSLDEIRTVSDGIDLRSQVAQMWLNTATAQAESLMRQPRWWERLQAAISEGEAATTEAFTLLSAVWHRWVTMMRVPAFALVRSGDRAQVLIAEGIPREIEVVVDRFEATREGCIHLRVALLQLDRSPALHLSGTPIAVAVNLGGEIVPLARGEVSGNQYEVSLALAPLLETLPVGELPQGPLVIELGNLPPPVGGQQIRIPLEVEGESPVWAEVHGLPKCTNEQIRMRVYLPDEVRQRYASYRLVAESRMTPFVWQKLGEWEISQWQGESAELTAVVPGLPDGVLPSTTIVRMRLVRREENA
ncbi:hypothetical protein HRbin16_03217 [bacterium HR16]|nr:hypothetical protein HRbin16_03217 [bacterium HR16]